MKRITYLIIWGGVLAIVSFSIIFYKNNSSNNYWKDYWKNYYNGYYRHKLDQLYDYKQMQLFVIENEDGIREISQILLSELAIIYSNTESGLTVFFDEINELVFRQDSKFNDEQKSFIAKCENITVSFSSFPLEDSRILYTYEVKEYEEEYPDCCWIMYGENIQYLDNYTEVLGLYDRISDDLLIFYTTT